MQLRLHSAVFLGSLITTSIVFGLSQFLNLGRGLLMIPATVILLISPDDVAVGPLAYFVSLLWFFIWPGFLLVFFVGSTGASLAAGWSLFQPQLTNRFWNIQTWIQICISALWILGLLAFDLYPVPQTPPLKQSMLFYIAPTIMLLNAFFMQIEHKRSAEQGAAANP